MHKCVVSANETHLITLTVPSDLKVDRESIMGLPRDDEGCTQRFAIAQIESNYPQCTHV